MIYPENISDNITLSEATRSRTAEMYGLENLPNEKELENMKHIANRIFQVVRKKVAKEKAILVTSFFRQKLVNAKIKGASKTSQHPKGEAMDLQKTPIAKYTNKEIFDFIKENLEFDQLIWEYGSKVEPKWVHVSLKRIGKNRNQVLYVGVK